MKNLLMSIILLIIFVTPFKSLAQEDESSTTETKEKSSLEINGSVDTYYTYDFAEQNNIPTSFADDRNSVSIGMVDISLSKSFEKVSFTGEVSFGPRSLKSIPTYYDGSLVNIQNLYMSYAVNDKLSLTAGYMGTFVGYELISPAGNFNYSTSYLFTSGPFQNAGIKADYAFSDKFAVMVGLFNDWNVYTDFDGVSDIGAQVYFAPVDGWDLYVNFVKGSATGTIIDVTTGYQISDAFFLGLNAADFTYDTKDNGGYSGVALYPQYAITDAVTLGVRGEYFETKEVKDEFGAVSSAKGSVFATTVSANLKMGGFTFIPEVRLDSSEDLGFLAKDGAVASSASQVTLAAVYAF